MEMNEKKHEKVRNNPTTEVNSSIKPDSDLLIICNEVITTRQNPRRFADAGRIC
jgi:hypothetical protein